MRRRDISWGRLPAWLLPALLLAASAAAQTNPLAPLSAREIRAAAKLFRDSPRFPRGAVFSQLTLDEPPKDAVLRGAPSPRRAFAILYDRAADHTFEAIADLSASRVDSWKQIPGAEPAITGDDSELAERIVRADPRWARAVRARGISNLNDVTVASWSAGYFGLQGTDQGRIVRALTYFRGDEGNFFAHPVEGIVAEVNLTTGQILEFLDIDRDAPVPREDAAFDNGPFRPAPAPLLITQPNGPGFQIEDGEVRWQKWRFRYALHPREGMVLYTVGYEDGGRVRPILYRGSVSEMVVPYGDPGGAWFFRNSFDAGELGLGVTATPLRPGVDCPTNCSVFNAVMADSGGQPRTIPRAVALYERDAGYAWKHGIDARRARELVLSFVATVGNYDYGFDWIFRQDGTLESRVALTGIMAVKAVADGRDDPYSHMVDKNIAAPHHQHFFTFRLDMDVDGASPNRVVELNSTPAPAGPNNPYRNAFTMRETPLRTEREAQRNLNLTTSRRWIVENTAQKNALGHPTAYALVPGANAIPFVAPDSHVRLRAGFLNQHLWVTPYEQTERYAAGDYPNQSHGGDGLPKWTAANRPIDNRDVVLWYTLGITHNPRPEDWPVMPTDVASFQLVPWGFFSRNPALDLPPLR
ncbi:MAG: primary-amine oxidase [Acidobacteriia bacterium]|nr:primary-amine oxidase [Terriglobia bacterium]